MLNLDNPSIKSIEILVEKLNYWCIYCFSSVSAFEPQPQITFNAINYEKYFFSSTMRIERDIVKDTEGSSVHWPNNGISSSSLTPFEWKFLIKFSSSYENCYIICNVKIDKI